MGRYAERSEGEKEGWVGVGIYVRAKYVGQGKRCSEGGTAANVDGVTRRETRGLQRGSTKADGSASTFGFKHRRRTGHLGAGWAVGIGRGRHLLGGGRVEEAWYKRPSHVIRFLE